MNARHPHSLRLHVLGVLALLGLIGFAGCDPTPTLPPGFGSGTPIITETPENFDLAFTVFENLVTFRLVRQRGPDETDPLANPDPKVSDPKELVYQVAIDLPQARDRVVFHLNNWAADAGAATEWERDALVSTLPQHIQSGPEIRTLNELRFDNDFDYLQQCIWARDVANWAVQSAPGPLTAATIAEVEAGLPADEAKQLATAVRLFDWTIRNIQLDPLLPQPTDVTAGPGDERTAVSPAKRGIPGPGYTAQPWQALLFGHGDAWQRARVFIVLARQAGIDVVMLAQEDTGPAGNHKPLLPAALVGGKLYLFDTALGLPLPGPDGKGIATLENILDQPALLRALDVQEGGETLSYPLTAEHFDHAVSLIDAEGAALSRRMRTVEERLSGNRKMVLVTAPQKTAGTLLKCRGIHHVWLWRVPFEATFYREMRPAVAARDQQMAAELVYEIQVFGNMTPPCTGRYSHLHGRFQPQGDDPGAVKWYLDARVADDDIAKLDFSATARDRIGFFKHEGESEESFKQRIAAASSRLQRVKSQATIWLSQIHYEKGEFGQTENWLQKIDAKDDDPNHGQIQYNLARAYEALGRIDDARRIYLLDESPQKLGNRLRAEMLRKLPAA